MSSVSTSISSTLIGKELNPSSGGSVSILTTSRSKLLPSTLDDDEAYDIVDAYNDGGERNEGEYVKCFIRCKQRKENNDAYLSEKNNNMILTTIICTWKKKINLLSRTTILLFKLHTVMVVVRLLK